MGVSTYKPKKKKQRTKSFFGLFLLTSKKINKIQGRKGHCRTRHGSVVNNIDVVVIIYILNINLTKVTK